MSLSLVTLAYAIGLIIVFSIALSIVKYLRNRRDSKHNGIKVVATVIDVQVRQDWKDGERWSRDAWSGTMKREKTWQTYYDIAAQWTHPQTGQSYTSCSTIWTDEVTKIPAKGDALLVSIDLHDPQRCRVVTS
jgi:hypothetical protein